MLFPAKVANPLVASDGWAFVDGVVRKAAEGNFEWQDLFFKRGALDHSQPLRKLSLLFHYRFFDLDFSIDAIAGVSFAIVNVAILWWVARSGRRGMPPSASEYFAFTALAAVFLSLTATVVFRYSSEQRRVGQECVGRGSSSVALLLYKK